jgi:hypothetical protein
MLVNVGFTIVVLANRVVDALNQRAEFSWFLGDVFTQRQALCQLSSPWRCGS